MENLFNKTFTGKWREFDSDVYYFGTLNTNLEGNSQLYSIGSSPKKWWGINSPPETIIGHFVETITGKNFTIILHKNIGHRQTFSAIDNFYLHFELTLISDKPIDNINSLDFDCLMISNQSFQEVLSSNNFEVNHDFESGNTIYKMEKPYDNKKLLYKDKFANLHIWWRREFPTSSSHEVLINNKAWLNLEFSTSLCLTQCLSEADKIGALFTTLSKKYVTFDLIELSHTCGSTFKIMGLKTRYNIAINRKTVDLLLTHSLTIFKNWNTLNVSLNFAIANFYNAIVSKEIDTQNKFLAYCFSLELLHRAYFNKNESLLKRHSSIIDRVSKELKGKGDLETWFSKYTSKNREISFQHRIEELIEGSELIINIPQFAIRIKDTRNKYVHLDKVNGNPFSDHEITQYLRHLSNLFIDIIYKKLLN